MLEVIQNWVRVDEIKSGKHKRPEAFGVPWLCIKIVITPEYAKKFKEKKKEVREKRICHEVFLRRGLTRAVVNEKLQEMEDKKFSD